MIVSGIAIPATLLIVAVVEMVMDYHSLKKQIRELEEEKKRL